MLLICGVGEDSLESLGLQGDPTSPSLRKSILNIHWKDWWWSWNSNTLTTWFEELTRLKRPWCWERLKVGGEENDRGWDSWMAPPTQWTWINNLTLGKYYVSESKYVLYEDIYMQQVFLFFISLAQCNWICVISEYLMWNCPFVYPFLVVTIEEIFSYRNQRALIL